MMKKDYHIYKALQRPLIYKGFQGKFIAWGIASLVAGVSLGGFLGSMTNMFLGGIITLSTVVAGLYYTSQKQKEGLYNKTRNRGVFEIKKLPNRMT